jgi:hypothetical protein
LRWLGEEEIAELEKREQEVVGDLPLVQSLLQQVNESEANYTSLYGEYDDLKNHYSTLETSYGSVLTQLGDIRNLLYFLLFSTSVLAVASIYLAKRKPASQSMKY